MNDVQGFESFQPPKADELSGIEFAILRLCMFHHVSQRVLLVFMHDVA